MIQSRPHMHMHILILILIVLHAITLPSSATADIPDLTAEQTIELNSTIDGRDHQDAGFYALIENARQWGSELGDAPVRLHPDIAAIAADPAAYRGELCRVAGRLEQVSPLDPPADDFVGLFIRPAPEVGASADEVPRALLAFVPASRLVGSPGDEVEVIARLYKLARYESREGTSIDYPAFVGAFITVQSDSRSSGIANGDNFLAIIAGVLGLMLIVFAVLMIRVRALRKRDRAARSRGPVHVRRSEREPLDEPTELPADPAEAMAVLRDKSRDE